MRKSTIDGWWHLGRWPTFFCVLALAGVAAAVFLAWNEARLAASAVRTVQHTFSVLLRIDGLHELLVDAETAQRGFLITGDAEYLRPYERALPQIRPTVDELRRATADNPAQQERIATLAPLVEAKLAVMAETIARVRRGESAARIVREDVGKRAMDSIRRLIAEAREEEFRLLNERLARRDEHLRGAKRYPVVLALLGSAVLLSLLASINRTLGARQAAERAARTSEARLRVTLESIGDAVIATDVAGRVAYMNPVAEALTGWRRAEAEGLPLDQVFRIVNEFSRDVVESPVSKVVREGGIVGLANHTLLLARDGSERPIDDSGAPIRDGHDKLMGIVLVFRDVSARRLSEQARERLLRAEADRTAAESASRAKDEFLAVVSHELRSPLTAAITWIEMLRSGSLGESDRLRAVDTIERNLRHQAHLVGDLLDVSRIAAGKLALEIVPADVSSIVADAVADQRSRAEIAGLALRHDRAEPEIAMVDPKRLHQVLSNLIGNAIAFTPRGGSIEVTSTANGHEVEIIVRDTGRGIPAHFLPHLFDRFRQAEPASVREHGGLGLGLSIARHLVEGHGGSITAESPGKERGATFRVRLPRPRGNELAFSPALATARASVLAGRTLLFVEDHADTRDALAYRLRMHGATVFVAGSVTEALAVARDRRFDLLLSDLGLPNEDGYSLIARLRSEEATPGRRTPAIAASGFAGSDNRRAALDAGFDAYLTKPIDFDALLAAVERLLPLHVDVP
jgi:PAS domain S-box-containing protein